MAVLKLNLEVVQGGLTEKEEATYSELLSGMFKEVDPLVASWEGSEIEEYNAALLPTKFVTTGRTVVCVGRNYAEHARELANAVPSAPLLFLKPVSAYLEEGRPIVLPPGATEVHHEVELGVVIGSPLSCLPPEAAMACVAGYCLALDMTDRAAQVTVTLPPPPNTRPTG